jgi:malonate decarboxylase delta subunit
VIEEFVFSHPASLAVARRAHVGVVASGDLEILLEPAEDKASILVRTSVPGHQETWRAVFSRFFDRWPYAVSIDINDHGATPGIVWLRLEQALELAHGRLDQPSGSNS